MVCQTLRHAVVVLASTVSWLPALGVRTTARNNSERTCSGIVEGASARDSQPFPLCKCQTCGWNCKLEVYCGSIWRAERKFNAMDLISIDGCDAPYCAKKATTTTTTTTTTVAKTALSHGTDSEQVAVLRTRGCPKNGQGVDTSASESTIARGVQCCSYSGDQCFRDGSVNKNFAESVAICRALNKRLCTLVEMDKTSANSKGLCCGRGHGVDGKSVWAVTKACTLSGYDRYNPDLGGCCERQCKEPRPQNDAHYCDSTHADHGVSCWSDIQMCRASCGQVVTTTTITTTTTTTTTLTTLVISTSTTVGTSNSSSIDSRRQSQSWRTSPLAYGIAICVGLLFMLVGWALRNTADPD